MKTIFILCMLGFSMLSAQTSLPHFSKYTNFERTLDGDRIAFTVNGEANIKCYLIEGSNDGTNFESIGAIKSAGNTVMPRTYQFESNLLCYNTIRVYQVSLTSLCVAFEIIRYRPNSITDPLPIDTERKLAIH